MPHDQTTIVNAIPGIPGPPGPAGPAGVGFTEIAVTIPALTTQDCDTNIASAIKGAGYRISAVTNDGLKSKTLYCIVTKDSVSIGDSIGFKVGALSIGVENLLQLGNHKLRLTNNETQPIVVKILKETY